MPLPTLQKTWQFSVNQTVTPQGSLTATARRVMRTLKNLLIGFGTLPWTVRGSCDSVAAGMDQVDRWDSDTDLVWAVSGAAHSWIVLRQTGIATNFEVCIDLNSSTAGQGSIVVSFSAGFTGGTTTNRPTATDESVVVSATNLMSNLDAQYQIHTMQSTDGECTRISIWRAGTNNCTFALFDKPNNPVTGWTNPSVSFWLAQTTTIAASYASLGNIATTALGRGRGVSNMNMACTGEGDPDGSLFIASDATIGGIANQLNSEWSMFPMGVCSLTTNNVGRHGSLFDIWWKPIGISDADTLPNDAANRDFVALGSIILPWTGDATIPLIT